MVALFIVLLASGGCLTVLCLLVALSQRLGRRFAWYARHEDAYLLLLMFKGVLLAVAVGYLIGVTQ